jgi:serpin B
VEKELSPSSITTAGGAGAASSPASPASGALLDEAVASLDQSAQVQLGLPKFKFRTQAGLKDALTALGMGVAFTDKADFSGMTMQEPLWISDVIHEAYVAVDEEGTEAAAATAVIMRTASAPEQMVQLTIDRPFIFALRDIDTGALLFLGRVTDPAA